MTTRNLYPIEAVVANVIFAVQTNDKQLLTYTISELVNSKEQDYALRILQLAWFLAPPGRYSRLCYDAWKTKNPFQFASAILTNTAFELPDICTFPQPPTKTIVSKYGVPEWTHFLPSTWSAAQRETFAVAVDKSIKIRNYTHAAYLMGIVEPAPILRLYGVPDDICYTIEQTVFVPLVVRIVEHALWIRETSSVLLPSPLVKTNGRAFKLQTKACDCWNVLPSLLKELIGIPIHLTTRGTQFWKDMIQKYNISIADESFISTSDESLEQFYIEGFPSDIPDEWSTQERDKSHPQWKPTDDKNPWRPAFLLV